MQKIIFQIICLLILTASVCAQEICPLPDKPHAELKSLDELKRITVLDNGRLKPLDTVARNLLLQISGRTTVEGKSAIRWLAQVMFGDPGISAQKIFLINHPDIVDALGIDADKHRRYSYTQLAENLPKLFDLAQKAKAIDSKKRSIVESELIRLEANATQFIRISQTLLFAIPHQDFTITNSETVRQLQLPDGRTEFTYYEIASCSQSLQKLLQQFANKPTESWSAAQQELITVTSNLFMWTQTFRDLPLAMVPTLEPDDEHWLSPWDALTTFGFRNETIAAEINSLTDALTAYSLGKQVEFDLSVKNFSASVDKRYVQRPNYHPSLIGLEVLFNQLNLFLIAKIFYFLATILFLLSLGILLPWMRTLTMASAGIGFIAHALGLLLRIIILQRPPVSTLYETFLFVGFVSVVAGFIIEAVQKRGLGLFISGLTGFIFLTIASKFSVEQDTLQMLVAVLNSNFWLGTHVLSITTGYAGVCVAGVVGHIYVLQRIFKPENTSLHDSTYRILIGTLAFGLIMSFLGTNLGGIWADESWGRFWGWDPKENGALLIILWTAFLFHLRVGNMIGAPGMAVGSIFGIMVVMWAWFGVNLLSIGLHSYGFTSGLARNLLIYVIAQLLFLAITFPILYRRSRNDYRRSS